MVEAMSALQSSFNLVCEKVQNLQEDNDRLKQQVAFFGSTRGTQPDSERINSHQSTLPLHPQNTNRQGVIRSSTMTDSSARNLGVSNSALSKQLSRGQLSSQRRYLNPSNFNNAHLQSIQQHNLQQPYNIKSSESPLQANNAVPPSPTLNINHESVTEIKNEIADECITFCRDKINEFMMNQQHLNQIQSEATPDRGGLSQMNVEKIIERKVEDFLGNIKDKLIDNYLQGSVRQRIYTIENKMQENFENLKQRFERKAKNLGQHEFHQHSSPTYSFSDSKNKIPSRQGTNLQLESRKDQMPGALQSQYMQSEVFLTQSKPVRDQAKKFEASKSQSSIGSQLPQQTQNINELFARLNMKLNQKASKLNQLKEQNEKEKYYTTPNKSNYNLLTNQRLMSAANGNDGTTYLNVSLTTQNQNPNNQNHE